MPYCCVWAMVPPFGGLERLGDAFLEALEVWPKPATRGSALGALEND